MTGYVAWTCNGCRDVHYMREPMYAGGLCRRCADRADCAPKIISRFVAPNVLVIDAEVG